MEHTIETGGTFIVLENIRVVSVGVVFDIRDLPVNDNDNLLPWRFYVRTVPGGESLRYATEAEAIKGRDSLVEAICDYIANWQGGVNQATEAN